MSNPFRTILHKPLLVGIFLGALMVFVVSEFTTNRRLDQFRSSLEASARESVSEVKRFSGLLARSEFSPATGKIIVDCTEAERERFETLLGQLDQGLAQKDLKEVDDLFGRCASVVAVRRALTLIEYTQAVASLETIVLQRKKIGSYESLDTFLVAANELVKQEQTMVEVSFALVYLQREIIDTLLEQPSAEALNELRAEGFRLRTQLIQVAESAQTLRQQLVGHE